MHLASFRKGWESESLAHFLLSRIAFIASPTTIADDVGSDFFCTFFTTLKDEGHTYLQPRATAAVQIKRTDKSTVDLSDKVPYLDKLELPYFLGVTDLSTSTLSLYSGCYLPLSQAWHGAPSVLTASLTGSLQADISAPGPLEPGVVPFPLLATLHPSAEESELESVRESIATHCSKVGVYVRSRLAMDFLFTYADNEALIAGPSSIQTFRARLAGRLAEALYNFDYLQRTGAEFDAAERDAVFNLAQHISTRPEAPALLRRYVDLQIASTEKPAV